MTEYFVQFMMISVICAALALYCFVTVPSILKEAKIEAFCQAKDMTYKTPGVSDYRCLEVVNGSVVVHRVFMVNGEPMLEAYE